MMIRSIESLGKKTRVTKRLFIALPLPDSVRQKLKKLTNQWQVDWPFQKWVDPADYHLKIPQQLLLGDGG
ncbi:hypothetical protein J2S00_000715 [Caldalkalibacillus uzonensis]|uniref:Uncharacterized protein n=1 Tax=Caldalkalibacillus uzonensis TaxID=353224 RepID=A0ABU0CP59_9BACI|nr:hypothetical protein [Caldalkalibacillus uzonensis]MDQ0337932.1 hypothetical protein [Caldalkalibacillus uzonensis]